MKEFRRKSALGRCVCVCASNERYRSGVRHGGWRPGKGGDGGVLTPCEVKGQRKDGGGRQKRQEGCKQKEREGGGGKRRRKVEKDGEEGRSKRTMSKRSR